MGKSIRIAIAEDHALFREGLTSLLKEEEGVSLIFEASNGEELLDKLKTNKVDVILLDLEMPVLSGKQTLKQLNTKFPSVRPIVLSMFEADKYISQAIKLGARGYLAKNCSIEKVVDAIYAVHEQGYYFDDEVSKIQLFKLVSDGRVEPKFTDEDLSTRELAVLELICNEKKNNEIADKLCISVRTVEVHRQNLLRKTNAKNVAGLVVYVIKKGYFEI